MGVKGVKVLAPFLIIYPSELGIGIEGKEPPRHGKFLLEQADQEEEFAFDQLLNEHDKLNVTMLYDHHGIATGTRGKEPARHGQLLPEQADQQEGCHRPLRLWLP